jgi:tetratricopeptide (TPR) repeat protein
MMGLCFVGCVTPSATTSGPTPSANATPLEKKLIENPDNAEVNFQLGEDAESHGDLLRAEQYYLRAEALRVDADRVTPRIIRVLVTAHRYGEALERCQRRLDAKPGDRATRYVEAALYAGLDRPKDAVRDLNALIDSQPKDPDAYLALGRLYKDANNHERAVQMFHKYLELAPDGRDAASVRFELASEGDATALGGKPEP